MVEEVRISKDVLKTMSDDTRADILKLLEQRQMTPSELSRALNKHVTTITKHLELLEKTSLVERVEREGHKWVYYKLTKNANRIMHPSPYYQWVVLLSVSFLVFVGSTAYSSDANPGDPLYGVKRSTETLRLMSSFDQEDRINLQWVFAERRLEEAKNAANKNDKVAVKSALGDYKKEIENIGLEISRAKGAGKDVTPLLEEYSEYMPRCIAILENIVRSHWELGEEVEPILRFTVDASANAAAELEEARKNA